MVVSEIIQWVSFGVSVYVAKYLLILGSDIRILFIIKLGNYDGLSLGSYDGKSCGKRPVYEFRILIVAKIVNDDGI